MHRKTKSKITSLADVVIFYIVARTAKGLMLVKTVLLQHGLPTGNHEIESFY